LNPIFQLAISLKSHTEQTPGLKQGSPRKLFFVNLILILERKENSGKLILKLKSRKKYKTKLQDQNKDPSEINKSKQL
jgi:hypothetical protein